MAKCCDLWDKENLMLLLPLLWALLCCSIQLLVVHNHQMAVLDMGRADKEEDYNNFCAPLRDPNALVQEDASLANLIWLM